MKQYGIAVIGAGMIGSAHASGYRAHAAGFAQHGAEFRLYSICDTRLDAARRVASVYGFEHAHTDWRRLMEDPDVHVVSVTLPNFEHADAVSAALRAGKHVLCEKPLALSAMDARKLVDLAGESRVVAGTVFNYRRWPAVADIRALLLDGAIGNVVHAHAQFQADYAADPETPHSWRYSRRLAGGGALHDVGAHAVDLLRFLCGEIVEITGANTSTTISRRSSSGGAKQEAFDVQAVDTDDVTTCVLRFASGAQGSMTASRVCVGSGNTLDFSISGTRGTISFSTRRPNEYRIVTLKGQSGGSVTRLNRADAPGIAEYTAVPHEGMSIGFGETFGFLVAEFLECIAKSHPLTNGSLEDGLRVAEVLDAVQLCAQLRRPVLLEELARGG